VLKYASAKTPLNGRFDQVDKIANPAEKALVKDRLARFGGDPKIAFKDLKKEPIWVDEAKQRVLEAVTLWEEQFVYKYSLGTGFTEKDVDSIVDVKVRELVRARFNERKGNREHPLRDLENDPIWLNQKKGLRIKSVRCFTGLRSLVPLHVAQNGVTKSAGKGASNTKPVDYVNERNNHHLAIYKDSGGICHPIMVSLMDAVKRKNIGLPVIINETAIRLHKLGENKITDQSILASFPGKDWDFITSLQQNEFFCLGIDLDEFQDLMNQNNYKKISDNLYRVQKLSLKSSGAFDIYFRHHLETRVDDAKMGGEMISKKIGRVVVIQSMSSFFEKKPIKVAIDNSGNIKQYK
jgi:CRISPR-associated endonuclease Csn1